MPFWDWTLKFVVNTHPDGDYFGGLVSLLGRYQVGQALITDVEEDNSLYRGWKADIAEAQLAPIVGQSGMRLTLGKGYHGYHNPGPTTTHIGEPNNYSKSPHHGSKTSSSEVFLEAVAPQVVVVLQVRIIVSDILRRRYCNATPSTG